MGPGGASAECGRRPAPFGGRARAILGSGVAGEKDGLR